MEKIEFKDIIGNSATYYFNKQSNPPEVFCSLNFGSNVFKSAYLVDKEWAVKLPAIVAMEMEKRHIYMVHYETNIAHFFAPIDKFKNNQHPCFHRGMSYYFCKISDTTFISKNIKSKYFNIDKLKEFKKIYAGISTQDNITSSIQVLDSSEIRSSFLEDINEEKSKLVPSKTERSITLEFIKKEDKIKPKQQYIQGSLF